ncbi:hypothetical protein [Segetibacter koreensis]|uniref:hypothetical protein n=1 Tax=Segetibacter koreensis TaxID=398037 RepID=UPI0003659005|nr:hypothetical protein [Segetibacter koreensis]
MIKLKIISFFLSLLIAIQMLPIAQIGNMLSKNQWTEELPHNAADDAGKADTFAKFNHPYLPPSGYSTGISFCSDSKELAYIHLSESIPSNHSTEVVIPPPDSVI